MTDNEAKDREEQKLCMGRIVRNVREVRRAEDCGVRRATTGLGTVDRSTPDWAGTGTKRDVERHQSEP